jgi:hypothetical protein
MAELSSPMVMLSGLDVKWYWAKGTVALKHTTTVEISRMT